MIEIMVIISIVLVGMLGVLSLLNQNIQAESINKNHFIAYQLAQEGIESARAVRDSDATTFFSLANGDYLFYFNGVYSPVTSTNQVNLCYANNLYSGCTDWNNPNTTFKRKVTLSKLTDGTTGFPYTDVLSTVTWTERTKTYSYSLDTHLYAWQ